MLKSCFFNRAGHRKVSFLVCCDLVLRREGKRNKITSEQRQIGLTWSIDIISGTAKARSRPTRRYESHPVSRDVDIVHLHRGNQVRRICLWNSFREGHRVFSSSKTTSATHKAALSHHHSGVGEIHTTLSYIYRTCRSSILSSHLLLHGISEA